MKAAAAMMTALVIAALPARAQLPEKPGSDFSYFSNAESHQRVDLNRACINYCAGLKSGNEGVIESAIAHVVRMKMYLKDQSFCDLRAIMNSLAVYGPTPAIRYKAYLASLVLDNPAWFAEECNKEYRNPTELFTALSSRLEKTLVALAGRKYVRPE